MALTPEEIYVISHKYADKLLVDIANNQLSTWKQGLIGSIDAKGLIAWHISTAMREALEHGK